MPVYLFTFHAYRSWMPDRPRGYVRRGEGVLPPDPKRAEEYHNRAQEPPRQFTFEQQQLLIATFADVCANLRWRLHAVATDPSHVHLLVSWREFSPWQDISRRLKNIASLALGRQVGVTDRKWFSRGGSRKRVRDREHFDYLVRQYLPSHRGVCWREGEELPRG